MLNWNASLGGYGCHSMMRKKYDGAMINLVFFTGITVFAACWLWAHRIKR